jgi:hypothetical protein
MFDRMFVPLLYSWLGFALVTIALDIVMAFISDTKATVKGKALVLSAVFSILSGLSLGVLTVGALMEQKSIKSIIWYIVGGAVVFPGLGFSASFYGGDYYARGFAFLVKKCFSEKFRQENKMTGEQIAGTAFIIAGALVMALFYREIFKVDFEMSFKSLLLWSYLPIFGACLGLGFYLPIAAVVRAYSGKWDENGNWVKRK